mgnify:CR=1 FL=1
MTKKIEVLVSFSATQDNIVAEDISPLVVNSRVN